MNEDLRSRLMPPEIGVISFFHQLFHLVPHDQYERMVSNITGTVMPALVKETVIPECSILPAFSFPHVKARCKTKILLLYIACLGNVWEVLYKREDMDGVQLSELLAEGSFSRHEYMSSMCVKNVSTLHNALFMGAVIRCILSNEGYATLLLFALTEHYERQFRQTQQSFSIMHKNSTLSAEELECLQPLAAIANEAMTTIFGAWNMGTRVQLKSAAGKKIMFYNQQCYAFCLALYNLIREMDGKGPLVWDKTLFSLDSGTKPPSGSAEQFLNEVNKLRAKVVDVFVSLDRPVFRAVAEPISAEEVMLSIKKQGFGKVVSTEVPLPRAVSVCVNAFTKNNVVTQYILCPGLNSITCLNEAYKRSTKTTKKQKKETQRPNERTKENETLPCHVKLLATNNTSASGQEFMGEQSITFHCSKQIESSALGVDSKICVPVVGYAGQNTEIKRHVYIYSTRPYFDMTSTILDFCKMYSNCHIIDCAQQLDWSCLPNKTQLLFLVNLNQSKCLPFCKLKALADRMPLFFPIAGSKRKRMRFTPRGDLQLIVLSSSSPYDLFGVWNSSRGRMGMNSVKIHDINNRFNVSRLDGDALNDMLFAEEKMQSKRQFVRHSNKISTGMGTCTFSLYRTQDNTGLGSSVNTFNFHISGNYLEFCISRAAVELDLMKSNPKHMYPVTMPVSTQQNTCTTVDLPGILNPETALSHSKMVWDPTSVPKVGPTKTTSFPAYNVYVEYSSEIQEFQQNRMAPANSSTHGRTKRPFPASDEPDADTQDNYRPPVSKRPRAYAVFDHRGIVCDSERYTHSKMKQMMKRSVSWEFHKKNINTSYFHGETLENRLREVLSWYLAQDGVEFDPRKQNFISSVEKEACALLPFSVLLLAEFDYIMGNIETSAELKVHDLFVSRSMICTYGTFSRGNAYMPLISKNMLCYISTQHKVQGLHSMYSMNKAVLCELAKREGMDMGQVKTQIRDCLEKNKPHMTFCSTRSRAQGLVTSLMYGSEYFVGKFLQAMPGVLKALKLSLKQRSDSMHVISVLERNYRKKK